MRRPGTPTRYGLPNRRPSNDREWMTVSFALHGLAAALQRSLSATMLLAGPYTSPAPNRPAAIRPAAIRSVAARSLPAGEVKPTAMAGPSAGGVGDGRGEEAGSGRHVPPNLLCVQPVDFYLN